MEQSAKNINFNEVAISDLVVANAEVIARGDYRLAYRNLARSLEKRFDTSLLRWRRLESPVADMTAALSISKEMNEAIADWHIDDETVNGYGDVWNLVRYMSFLLNQSAELPGDRMVNIREDRSQHADLAIDYLVLDVIECSGQGESVNVSLGRLAEHKRQSLAMETYRTYFDLLSSDGSEERTEALVRKAEVNYKKRARDGFYGGGPTYMGGGPDNPYVVDFVLAAVLKKINWTGESVHKWMWNCEQ